jgi:hypothetical protein
MSLKLFLTKRRTRGKRLTLVRTRGRIGRDKAIDIIAHTDIRFDTYFSHCGNNFHKYKRKSVINSFS